MEKKKFRFPTLEQLEKWVKSLSAEDVKLLESKDPVVDSLIQLTFNSTWSKIDDGLLIETLRISQHEHVEFIDILLVKTRFSKCYLFSEFDSIMEEAGLEIDGELFSKEMLKTIFSSYDSMLQISNTTQEVTSTTINIGSHNRFNLPITPAFRRFMEEQQKEAENFDKFFSGLNRLGREKNVPTLQFPPETLLGKSKPLIRQHFLKGVYNDIRLVTEGKRGTKLEKQFLIKPLIEIIATDYPFPTEEEWAARTDQNDSETTMSYREKIGKMVAQFIGE